MAVSAPCLIPGSWAKQPVTESVVVQDGCTYNHKPTKAVMDGVWSAGRLNRPPQLNMRPVDRADCDSHMMDVTEQEGTRLCLTLSF